jgi:hypothetical protein
VELFVVANVAGLLAMPINNAPTTATEQRMRRRLTI